MPEKMFEKIIVHAIVAFVGGISRYLSDHDTPTLAKIFIGGIIGSFVGIVFFCFASFISTNQYWTASMAGLGGWFGREGMDWIFRVIQNSVHKI